MPLVMVFTTDIHDSLIGTFTPIGQILGKAGFTIAAVDVTCHGKDVHAGEIAGLDCWASRAKSSKSDVFAPMVGNASAVISDISAHHFADTSSVIAVGVSRGGYAAIRLAMADSRVDKLILMAPVTDLWRLEEFKGMRPNDGGYGFDAGSLNRLSHDHIFMQIGNADTRVGTAQALQFEVAVVGAGDDRLVDFTTIMTPLRGHGTARHDLAANWVMQEFKTKSTAAMRAP